MGDMDSYKESMKYIEDTFDMKGRSLYQLVAKITEEYQQLKMEKELLTNVKEKTEEEPCQKKPKTLKKKKSSQSKSQKFKK